MAEASEVPRLERARIPTKQTRKAMSYVYPSPKYILCSTGAHNTNKPVPGSGKASSHCPLLD
eukprot:scaffold244_cov200-Alexandrium_tamarense.AAC.12